MVIKNVQNRSEKVIKSYKNGSDYSLDTLEVYFEFRELHVSNAHDFHKMYGFGTVYIYQRRVCNGSFLKEHLSKFTYFYWHKSSKLNRLNSQKSRLLRIKCEDFKTKKKLLRAAKTLEIAPLRMFASTRTSPDSREKMKRT